MFAPGSKRDRRHRLLEARFDCWYKQPQPVRFYLWLFWLHLVPLLWIYFKITAWSRRCMVKGFTELTMPSISASYPYRLVAEDLVSIQPMTKPTTGIFYIDYKDWVESRNPQTRKEAGWLWGIVVWETI